MRRLNRTSAHRKALLRNLATSLLLHESITTTWPKAKEAQRYTEKLITIAKSGTDISAKQRAGKRLFASETVLPKLFSEIRQRYINRPGGYTRVLMIPPRRGDGAPQAILELVNGEREMRASMTARAIALSKLKGEETLHRITNTNKRKVIAYRPNGEEFLKEQVEKQAKLLKKGAKAGRASPTVVEALSRLSIKT